MRLRTSVAALLVLAAALCAAGAFARHHKKNGKYGPGSTMAGGLLALPPARSLGPNVLPNADLKSKAGWYIPAKCWTPDPSVTYSGSESLRFTAAAGCPMVAYTPEMTYRVDPRYIGSPYTFSVWAKASPGSNLQARVYVFDDTAATLPAGSSSDVPVGADWTHVTLPNDDLLPLHNGDKLRMRLIVSSPRGEPPTGTVWLAHPAAQPELPLPISSFLLYPNFRGYLWQGGPQTIRLRVESGEPAGNTAQIVVQSEGGGGVKTVQKPAAPSQEIDVDASSLALGSYLIHTNLLDGSGKIIFRYPDYRVTKVSDAFRAKLVNYIDRDNFLVHDGKKEFVWGVYDRTSSARCSLCMYRTAAEYKKLMKGFDGKTTMENYQDTHINALINFAPWSAMAPGAPAIYDQLDPALEALEDYGVGYLQTVNNWVKPNRYRPFWAGSLSDEKLWELAGKMMSGKKAGIGYYTFDEPQLQELPLVFEQYRALRKYNPGSVAYGALINASQIYRWRDAADAIGCDPYPVGVPVTADEASLKIPLTNTKAPSYQPPMVRVSLWTKATREQVEDSRPVWMVLQLFRQWGRFPTYEEMKSSAYQAIINGAHGILWWGFVSGVGIEAEWAHGDTQAYFNFKRLSDEVTGLGPLLLAPAQPQYLVSTSNPEIESIVKAGANSIAIITCNMSPKAISGVTFRVNGVKMPGSVTVYSEGRTLPLDAHGNFSDSFGGYQAHVYMLTLQ